MKPSLNTADYNSATLKGVDKREMGYYWILLLNNHFWEPALYNNNQWLVCGTLRRYHDADIWQIGEKIIRN